MAPNLATLLVAEKLLPRAELTRIERERAASGQRLWSALVEAELATANQIHALLDATGAFTGVDQQWLGKVVPPVRLVAALSAEDALAGGILPLELSVDGREAVVAMADPSDAALVEEFRAAAGVEAVRALLAPPQPLSTALRRIYRSEASTVELDPSLAHELEQLPPGALRTPPQRPSPWMVPDAVPEEVTPRSSSPAQADVRLIRAMTEVIEVLVATLETRLGGRPRALELARLSRRVARQLGCERAAVDEIGVVALLLAVHRALGLAEGRAAESAAELIESLGWPAAGEGGIAHALRVLTAASSPFGRLAAGPSPLGARIVAAAADYLELTDDESGQTPDLGTVSQLLRAGNATAPVVDALLRVLDTSEVARTPGHKRPRKGAKKE